jgi:hypothetical protein
MGDLGFSERAEWKYRPDDADGCCLRVLYAAHDAGLTREHDAEIGCVCGRAWSCVCGWWRMPPRLRIRHDARGYGFGRSQTARNRRAEMRTRVEARRK